ncbi:M23 family metallopeptidase [Rheinheimera sp.]|uniref:M23 family metallopeptidase n=1 Tax=Rheinheimera sp. TaxID=1869214 RepID=UPI002FDCCDE4
MKIRNISICVICALGLQALASGVLQAAEPIRPPESLELVHPLVYSYDEMFHFDIEAYLASQAPHLLPYAEPISHWAGYSSISPRVLITLIEQHSGIVTDGKADEARMQRPFASLSAKLGFNAQLQDVSHQLAERIYSGQKRPEAQEFLQNHDADPLGYLFSQNSEFAKPVVQQVRFNQLYQKLFAEDFKAAQVKIRQPQSMLLAGPANGFLQFPFPTGQSWHVGGAHTNTGSGSYPMSSLDMSQGGGWGSNQSGVWVAASAGGSFKRHSSCFAEVVHSGGWSTTYYHLMNIQYGTGATVYKNTRIANPANSQAQALCNGGSSTGPHQHWSLKQNGSWTHLHGVYLSGWQITATGSSYDTNCTRYYLTKNGVKRCAGYFSH